MRSRRPVGLMVSRFVPRLESRFVMFEVVPWPTPTSATTEATPMITPSIVRAARRRLVRRRDSARRRSSHEAHAAIRPSSRWIWRPAAWATATSWVIRTIVRPAALQLVEEVHHLGAGVAVEVAGRLVGEDQRRLGDERPGDRDALLLAARQLGRLMGQAIAESQPLERGLGPRRTLRRARRPGRGEGVATLSRAEVRGSRL